MRANIIVCLALACLALGAGCASYTGGGKAIAPEKIDPDDGWIMAAPTPTVKQRELADCGAAALAMVAGRWRVSLSREQAAQALPPPTRRGVMLKDLRAAAREHGLVAFAVVGDKAMLLHELGARRPVVLGLLRPTGPRRASSHFEVVIALRPTKAGELKADSEIVTIDPGGPGSGWRVRPWKDLDAEWKLAGRPALVVIGTEN